MTKNLLVRPALSHEFYEALRELLPGLPAPDGVKSLRFVLEAGEPAIVEIETFVGNRRGGTIKSKFNLIERE